MIAAGRGGKGGGRGRYEREVRGGQATGYWDAWWRRGGGRGGCRSRTGRGTAGNWSVAGKKSVIGGRERGKGVVRRRYEGAMYPGRVGQGAIGRLNSIRGGRRDGGG